MYIDSNSLAGGKALAECPFLPFALAEAARFCKKYPGRFDLNELQSVAAEALITSKGFGHAKIAIAGALADFARDDHKVVRDIEMSEEDFARTRGGPPSNARLMAGPGKASSKHGKVRLALGRSSFKDGWNQKLDTKWVRAKGVDGDADDSEAVDPRGGEIAIGPAAPGGEVEISNPNRVAPLVIHPHVMPPLPYIGIGPSNQRKPKAPSSAPPGFLWRPDLREWLCGGLRWSGFAGLPHYNVDDNHERVAIIPEDYGRKRKRSGFADLELNIPRLTSVGWHREAGYLRFSDDEDPKTWWGLPGSSTAGDDSAEFGRFKDPWWRGENLFSPAVLKVPVRGELICERDAPSRLAQTTAALGGSRAGRGAFHLPPTPKRRRTRRTAIMDPTTGIVNWQPRVAGGTTPLLPRPHSGNASRCLDANWPIGGRIS